MSEITLLLKEENLSGNDFSSVLTSLKSIKSRKVAFFDQYLVGYVLVSKQPSKTVGQITLDINIHDPDTNSDIPSATSTFIKPQFTNEDGTQSIYRFELFIPFPKASRIKTPLLFIRTQTSLRSKTIRSHFNSKIISKPLVSFYPAEKRNILEGINHSLIHEDSKIVLSESLIKAEEPDSEENGEDIVTDVKSIEVSDTLQLPIIRTLSLRVISIRLKNDTILSTVEVEQSTRSKQLDLSITVSNIDFKFQNTITPKFNTSFPVEIAKDERYAFTYQLDSSDPTTYTSIIDVTYLVNNSHKIKSRILTESDFSTSIASSTQPKKSLNTPPLTNTLASSLNIKFKGHKVIKLGEPSKLQVHIENKISRERNLVLVFNSLNNDNFIANLPKIKSLTQSNHQVLKSYSSLKLKTIGVLSLVNEIHFRVGPEQIFENEIEVVGLDIGVFNVQGVKLIDLQTNESVNCDKLLEIIVEN